jgi:hypothetical protein
MTQRLQHQGYRPTKEAETDMHVVAAEVSTIDEPK